MAQFVPDQNKGRMDQAKAEPEQQDLNRGERTFCNDPACKQKRDSKQRRHDEEQAAIIGVAFKLHHDLERYIATIAAKDMIQRGANPKEQHQWWDRNAPIRGAETESA